MITDRALAPGQLIDGRAADLTHIVTGGTSFDLACQHAEIPAGRLFDFQPPFPEAVCGHYK